MSTFYEHREEKVFIGEMTQYPFPVHVHEVAEIIAVTTGSIRISIDSIFYTLMPGDVAIIFPFSPHSYEYIGEGARGVAAIFLPELIQEYAGTFHGLIPEYPILRAEQTGEDLKRAVDRLSELNMEEDLPFCIAYLHVVLAGTLHQMAYKPVYDYSEQDLGYRIMHYVSDHVAEDLSLESVSKALGISTSHLSHFFAEKLHIPFRTFINANRIARARLLMRNPAMTLSMICAECGYTNMRTFRRAFLKEVGHLPSDQKRKLKERVTGPE